MFRGCSKSLYRHIHAQSHKISRTKPDIVKYHLPPLLFADHSSFVPIPWEWLRAMANQAYNNNNSVNISFTNTLDDENISIMVGIPKGVDCKKLRGEDTTWPDNSECPSNEMLIKVKDVDTIIQLSTDDGTTFDDTFYFILNTKDPSHIESCLFTPAVNDQYKIFDQFPGYDIGGTMCDGADYSESTIYWIYKKEANINDYIDEQDYKDLLDGKPKFKNDRVELIQTLLGCSQSPVVQVNRWLIYALYKLVGNKDWIQPLIQGGTPSVLIHLAMSSDKWTSLGAIVTLSCLIKQDESTIQAIHDTDWNKLNTLQISSPIEEVVKEINSIVYKYKYR